MCWKVETSSKEKQIRFIALTIWRAGSDSEWPVYFVYARRKVLNASTDKPMNCF
jgi:hypothetical protein